MIVTPIAHTTLTGHWPASVEGTPFYDRVEGFDGSLEIDADVDTLHEFAGRACYQSWQVPNPATSTNEGYLDNIQQQLHFSVLEHGNVTFYIEHASRALLLELERHRHPSLSVESQRYVDPRRYHPEPVIPPAYRREELAHLAEDLKAHYEECLAKYDTAYLDAREAGLSIKEAREAARAFLPESTPVNFVWTANVRAIRDMLGKRWHVAADAEIREFAGEILRHLRELAPHSVQDIPEAPFQ